MFKARRYCFQRLYVYAVPVVGSVSAWKLIIVLGLMSAWAIAVADEHRRHQFALGHPPNETQIADWDIAIGPEGAELPPGSGTVAAGRTLYAERCALCHGATGKEGPDPILVGGRGTLASARPLRTIGSYWAFSTTLYDYIYRAMPFVAPGSLSPDEVYALSAFLLFANGIIDENTVMDRLSLPAVQMPNRDGFDPDPRPESARNRIARRAQSP